MFYSPRVFIEGVENVNLDSYNISYPGSNQLNKCSIVLSDPNFDGSALFGKRVELFVNCGSEDVIPTFRGVIKNINSSDINVTLTCHDVRTYITGQQGKSITFDDIRNYDGFSVGQYLKSYIEQHINTKDDVFIGTDMLTDVENCNNMNEVRGDMKVLDAAVGVLEDIIEDTVGDEPLRYIFDVVEGPDYSNLVIKKQKSLKEKPSLSLSLNDGIKSFSYKRRPAPKSILITNSKLDITTNIDLAGPNHGPFSASLSGAYEDTSSARKAGILELRKLQQEIDEISLEVTRGHDIGLESLVFVKVENSEIDGIHRVVSKNITGSMSGMQVNLELNKRPVKVSDYLSKA